MSVDDEFKLVTRKKWISRRKIHVPLSGFQDADDMVKVDTKEYLKRFASLCLTMESSEYYKNSMKTLRDASVSVENLVCFGIGPFTRTFNAMHQLAFSICVQRNLGINGIKALYYDPVFSEEEKEILKDLNCGVMEVNCCAKYAADVPTLFYLPHCDTFLSNNLLWRNWRPDQLPNVILISNSFHSILSNAIGKTLKNDYSCVADVSEYVKEFPLPNIYHYKNIFNDLSLHIFTSNALPKPDEDSFWNAARPEPKTTSSNEVILQDTFLSDQLNKIKLN